MIEMTDERAAEVLAAHNEWRRYDGFPGDPGSPPLGDPTEIGRAIDHVVSRFRSQPPAEAQEQGGREVDGLVRDLVREIERNTCTHEDTHRGGAIWEICNACGEKWADDRGGKPDFKWPDCVERARAWLAQQPAAVGVDANELTGVRARLKSGDYDGADVMKAWLAIDKLLALLRDQEEGK